MTSCDVRRVDPALRARYDVRGPRYTSYPTAPFFGPVDEALLFARWRERDRLPDDPGLSLYVHVPFCRRRCLFCGCHTWIGQPDDVLHAYVEELAAEMALAARVVSPARPVRQVALGGGTPNALSVERIHRLLSALASTWSLAPGAELSVEIDPRAVSVDQLDAFVAHGFNRFSLGVQDLHPPVLEAVGRRAERAQIESVVAHLRARGQERINFDLIHGLPRQTEQSARQTAAEVIALRPSRVAVYSYAHVPWMQRHQEALVRHGLPDPDQKLAIFAALADALVDAGYVPVGIDHFALPDDPLVRAQADRTLRRTFMGYTTGRGLDNLGFGASAISWVGATYAQGEKELAPWRDAVRAGRLPVARGYLLTADDVLRQAVILELSCNLRVDLGELSAALGVDAPAALAASLVRLRPMVDDGLVRVAGDTVEIVGDGRFFVRNACMAFDAFLEADPEARRYSRTV